MVMREQTVRGDAELALRMSDGLVRGVRRAGTHTRVNEEITCPSDTTTFARRLSVENIVSVLELTVVCAALPSSSPNTSRAVDMRPSCTPSVAAERSPRRT